MKITISEAKSITQCDSCKMTLPPKKKGKVKEGEPDEGAENIAATLNQANGGTKDYHFCDEECLRLFLNERANRRRGNASIIELDLTKGKKQ